MFERNDLMPLAPQLEHSWPERRESVRFPIQLALEYKSIHRSLALAGVGSSLNVSSSGIFFTSDERLPLSTRLEVRINWPVALGEQYPLQLVARGIVSRAGQGHIALQIMQYRFQLRPQIFAIPENLPHHITARLSKYHS